MIIISSEVGGGEEAQHYQPKMEITGKNTP